MCRIRPHAPRGPLGRLARLKQPVSLRAGITLYFVATMVTLSLLVGVITLTRFARIAEEDAAARTRQTVFQANAGLDLYIRSMLETTNFLFDLFNDQRDITDPALIEQMCFLQSSRRDIANMAVFSRDGRILAGTAVPSEERDIDVRSLDWFRILVDNKAISGNDAAQQDDIPLSNQSNTVFFSSPHREDPLSSYSQDVITLSRAMLYWQDGQRKEGVLMLSVNFSSIDTLCRNVSLGRSGFVYLIDRNGKFVYNPEQEGRPRESAESLQQVQDQVFGHFLDSYQGRTRFVTIATVNSTRWRIVGVAYADEVLTLLPETIRLIVVVLSGGSLLTFVLALLLSRRIAQPLQLLRNAMRRVEDGELEVDLPEQGWREVRSLAHSLRHMMAHIRALMDQIVQEQEKKRLYELNALQAQINPHFLYNTLDSIVWMQERGQSRASITMVTALARLFRISISKGRNIISIGEEMEHVRNYLIIQSIRFKNKFDYTLDVTPEALPLRTVKLIVQPIVENAIQHGLEEYAVEHGLIEIHCYVESGTVCIRVCDNGAGMPQEQADRLLSGEAQGTSGIGIKNVHERIQLTYGRQYGLTIHSEVDCGTEVIIRQPYIEEATKP